MAAWPMQRADAPFIRRIYEPNRRRRGEEIFDGQATIKTDSSRMRAHTQHTTEQQQQQVERCCCCIMGITRHNAGHFCRSGCA